VTVLNQTPSAFRQLMRADETGDRAGLALRYVIFGGEALDLAMLKPWFERHGDARPRLVNMYGITETTVHVTYRPVTARDVDGGSVIGVPIPDLHIHLLDASGTKVRDGDPGEIHVGGAGVALGYLNRPEMTTQRFVPDPFADPLPDGARRLMYRSGDLGRRLPGGDLEYLGRIDTQVKIRGFRIELAEISAVMNRHDGVLDSVVVLGETAAGDKVLWAYVVKRAGAEVDTAGLRRLLRDQLPEYMIPAAYVFIDRLPLTVNGKLDRAALPRPTVAGAAAIPVPSGATGLERSIAGIWQEVLEIPAPGVDENFFDVGGTSIHVAEVHVRLQRLLGRAIPITDLFAHSTIRGLAAHFSASAPVAAGEAQRRAQRQREALALRRPGRGTSPGPS
jgi:acyl-coenzyme A synthetase/AMP-(fatty) acid ligase